MRPIVVRRGRVIDPANALDDICDVLVAGGKVEAITRPGALHAPDGSTVLDAQSWWVTPGLVDPHVHLRDPGPAEKETIASGLRAAAAGGFTTVAAMANTDPVNDKPEIARYMLERARETHAARLVPVAAVTVGLAGVQLTDFAAMADAGARLFSDDGMPIDDPAILARALDAIGRLGFAVSLHEEDCSLSNHAPVNAGAVSERLRVKGYPAAAETRRLRRDLALAGAAGAPVHIAHLSCAESVALVAGARRSGARVTCEVTPHHFSLEDSSVLRWGPNAKMNPPLRSREDLDAIRAAMAEGSIDMIATDHAPHDPASKKIDALAGCFARTRPAGPLSPDEAQALTEAASGIVGLETSVGLALGLVHQGVIGAGRMVEMMSLNPARLLRLEAGSLSRGAPADITIIDPDLQWTVDPSKFLSHSRNTPFAAMRLTGKAILSMVAGEIVYDARTTGNA